MNIRHSASKKPQWFTLVAGIFASATLLLLVQPLLAQQPTASTIEGVVRSEKTQEPIAGVAVKLTEIQTKVVRGGISDKNGKFSVSGLPAGSYALQAMYLGFKPYKTALVLDGNAQALVIDLKDDPIRSEEVVVSGQGVGVERRRVSTNTAVISAEQITQVPVPRLEQVLQAQVPNAQFTMRSGQPGTSSMIRSRGINSVSVGSTPIIYVDGVRLDNLNSPATLTPSVSSFANYPVAQSSQSGALADVPMDNIDRIEFINGGAATTLYGSDAANGVIQIFTKNGLGRPSSLTFETRLGVDAPTTQFLRFRRTPELLYQAGFAQQYVLAANGGSADWGYSVAASARNGEGFRINNSQYAEYSTRVGLNAQISPLLRYVSSFGLASNTYRRAKDGNAGNYTPLWTVEDGFADAFGFPRDVDAMPDTTFARFKEFIRRAEDLTDNRVSLLRFQTSQMFEFTPLENLTIRALGGMDVRRSNERIILTNEYLTHTRVVPQGTSNRGSIDEVTREFTSLTMELTAQHRTDISTSLGELSFISNVGGQLFRNSDDQTRIFGDNVRDGAKIIAGAGIQTSDQFRLQVVNYGVYALENIGLNNRYFLEFGLRADGNTAFGRDVGLQLFPKIGLSYVLSDEPFWEELKTAISNVRLRANYGVAGNFPPPFRRDRTIAFSSYLGQPAASFGQAENRELRPERTTTTEFGADMSLLGDALTFGATYYNATTNDALFTVPNPTSVAEQSTLRNVGVIINRGVELRASATLVSTAEAFVQLNASFNSNSNEVLSSGTAQPFAIGGYGAGTVQNIVAQGLPIGFIRGARAVPTSDTSYTVKFLDNLGSTIPSAFGSVSLSATLWGSVNFTIASDYQWGAWAHSFDQQFRFLRGIGDGRVPQSFLDAQARRGLQVNQIWTNFMNYFVERTDFWRVRFLALSYDLPQAWYEGVCKHITVGVSVANPFGWTSATFDPEASAASVISQGGATVTGTSYGIDSAPRTILGTLRVRF